MEKVTIVLIIVVGVNCMLTNILDFLKSKKVLNNQKCNCKRTDKYKDNYLEKNENKNIDNTLTSDLWR